MTLVIFYSFNCSLSHDLKRTEFVEHPENLSIGPVTIGHGRITFHNRALNKTINKIRSYLSRCAADDCLSPRAKRCQLHSPFLEKSIKILHEESEFVENFLLSLVTTSIIYRRLVCEIDENRKIFALSFPAASTARESWTTKESR